MHKPILARNLLKALSEAGIIPANCRRVVIDLGTHEAARLYFECLGDERLLQVITGSNVVEVKE